LTSRDCAPRLAPAIFAFTVGNNSTPSGWVAGPAPSAIVVRRHAGRGGADRIDLTWPDGAIRNEWLQVTLKPDLATGLAAADVLYFGNAVGEVGNSASDAMVTSADELAARDDLHSFLNPAALTNPHDYNRDGRVDAIDEILARNNATNTSTALQLIHPPLQTAAASMLDLLKKKSRRR
jgi:hypothetical protein